MSNTNQVEFSDYDALNFDGLELPNYREISYREDFLHIFENKKNATLVFQSIYDKARQRGPAKWVAISYNDLVNKAGGAVGYNTVISSIYYLVHEKCVLEQRPCSPQGFEYRVIIPIVTVLLDALPDNPAYAQKSTNHGIHSQKIITIPSLLAQHSLLMRFDGQCAYCRAEPTTWDHITPFNRGGKTTLENLVPACQSCNSSKGIKPVRVWLQSTGKSPHPMLEIVLNKIEEGGQS